MSDKGGGFFDNPFGGFFDFNGDGKEDPVEIFLAYKMFDEMTKEDNDSDSLEDDLCGIFATTALNTALIPMNMILRKNTKRH